MSLKTLGVVCLVVSCAGACGSPAAPFDQLKSANVVAYRLQPVPAPAPTAPVTQTGATLPAIPGIPPELQAWAQQAAPALQQLLPPGLIPPGLIPGVPAPQAPAAPAQQLPQFHGFPIVGQSAVVSADLKSDLADLFGDEDSFQQQHFNCFYAEFGISFATTPGAPPNDVLLSMSCNQVQGHNFIWPHGSTGLTPDTVKALSILIPKLFPGGGGAVGNNSQTPLLVQL